ncbi:MAG TPA: hypothetical protein VNT53_11170 [Pseudolysinimonas sp.]|nr:hypothetical protein [Pseudolysinimonas sp.]
MELLELPTALPLTSAPRGLTVVPRRGALWRVTRADGVVLGYVEKVSDGGGASGGGTRFRSKRLRERATGFHIIGDFWSADDAVDALRHP